MTREVNRQDFNPPSPWGEGLPFVLTYVATCGFQSTLPVGGGTEDFAPEANTLYISIHPPRGGRDVSVCGDALR